MKTKLLSAALAAGMTGLLATTITMTATPAQALVVFDPSNYGQAVLTAARTLEQINNQIRMLQNQARSLTNQARNLSTISFPEIQALQQTLQQIDRLMGQAQGIRFQVSGLDQRFKALFPNDLDAALRTDAQVIAARRRLDTSLAAFRQTMTVQSQVVENVEADARALGKIVARSQGAEGALQAQQASTQLLALVAKQQFQIQTLMAAQYRAEAIERANRLQQQTDAQTATRRFLGSGNAYNPR